MPASITDFTVELPSGGKLHLQTPDEVDLWETAQRRYLEDYVLTKHNDLVTLGALLQQQIILFRCQTAINGMEPELDANKVPTGSYKRVELDGADLAAYQKTLTEAAKEMRALEKQLGIDKATREQGGTHTLDNYIRTLKRAAHDRGVHVTRQVLEYQRVMSELRWKLRMLYHADKQDRAYHNVTPRTVLDWLKGEVEHLEQLDQQFARETGKLYVGQL
jgi:hypothetical protein